MDSPVVSIAGEFVVVAAVPTDLAKALRAKSPRRHTPCIDCASRRGCHGSRRSGSRRCGKRRAAGSGRDSLGAILYICLDGLNALTGSPDVTSPAIL